MSRRVVRELRTEGSAHLSLSFLGERRSDVGEGYVRPSENLPYSTPGLSFSSVSLTYPSTVPLTSDTNITVSLATHACPSGRGTGYLRVLWWVPRGNRREGRFPEGVQSLAISRGATTSGEGGGKGEGCR